MDQDFNNLIPKCQHLAQVIFKVLVDMVHLIKVCKVPKIKWALILDVRCHNTKVVVLSHLMEMVLVTHLQEVNIRCLNLVEVDIQCLHLVEVVIQCLHLVEVDILCHNLEVVAHQVSVVTVHRHHLVTLLIVQLLQSVVVLAI